MTLTTETQAAPSATFTPAGTAAGVAALASGQVTHCEECGFLYSLSEFLAFLDGQAPLAPCRCARH